MRLGPLHGATDPALVDLLVDRSADIEARCEDHASTPLQYLIQNTAVARRLIERGAHVDIFSAAVLGDVELIRAGQPLALDVTVGIERH